MFTITDAAGEYLTTLWDNAHISNKTAIRFLLDFVAQRELCVPNRAVTP